MRPIELLIAFLAFLLVATNVMAMSSMNYRFEWFTPGTSGGGGTMNSTHFAANVTVGQTISGHSDSTNYTTGLGYWSGVPLEWLLHLPAILR